MRVVYICNWYSKSMGYSIAKIPKYAVRCNISASLLTSEREVYGVRKFKSWYKDHLQAFLGAPKKNSEISQQDGFVLIRTKSFEVFKQIYLSRLSFFLRLLKPEIVQSGELLGLTTVRLCLLKNRLRYQLVSECHIHASVFSDFNRKDIFTKIKWRIYRDTISRFILSKIDYVFAISEDSAFIANKFYGIKKEKICTIPMGIDFDYVPLESEWPAIRRRIRNFINIEENTFLCIYTGRIGPEKKVDVLVEAVQQLQVFGLNVKLLLIGNGAQGYLEKLRKIGLFYHLDFLNHSEIMDYYVSADLGVWPSQESISQLDALACGTPILVSENIQAQERIFGEMLKLKEGSTEDLIDKILYFYNNRQSLLDVANRVKSFASDNLSWGTTLDKYYSLYQNLSDSKEKETR